MAGDMEAHMYHVDVLRYVTGAYPDLAKMQGRFGNEVFFARIIKKIESNREPVTPSDIEFIDHFVKRLAAEHAREPLTSPTDADSRMVNFAGGGGSCIAVGPQGDPESYAIPVTDSSNARMQPLSDLVGN